MKRKILIIDDEEHTVEVIKARLTANGYTVVTACNGKEGLEQLKTVRPDLIVLDVLMPVMDGFEFLKIIKKDSAMADIPVLMLTCRGHMRDTFEILNVNEFIVKPFETDDLLSKIDALTKFKLLMLSDNYALINTVNRFAIKKGGIVDATQEEASLIEKAQKDRYSGVIIHTPFEKQKPKELIQNIRMPKNEKTRIVIYSDSKQENTANGADADIHAEKKEWEKAGANLFFNTLLVKEPFFDTLIKLFA